MHYMLFNIDIDRVLLGTELLRHTNDSLFMLLSFFNLKTKKNLIFKSTNASMMYYYIILYYCNKYIAVFLSTLY